MIWGLVWGGPYIVELLYLCWLSVTWGNHGEVISNFLEINKSKIDLTFTTILLGRESRWCACVSFMSQTGIAKTSLHYKDPTNQYLISRLPGPLWVWHWWKGAIVLKGVIPFCKKAAMFSLLTWLFYQVELGFKWLIFFGQASPMTFFFTSSCQTVYKVLYDNVCLLCNLTGGHFASSFPIELHSATPRQVLLLPKERTLLL